MTDRPPPEPPPRAPISFWLVMGAAVLYLGWRLIQGIAWVIGRFG